jgi:deoxyribodipyrimidine photo-lyase
VKGCFKQECNRIQWSGTQNYFRLWCNGMTGYPIIDAAMRCFNQTGWMHNRLRMIVACFLTKDLLVDWRKGESWFARNLLDFDLAANNGGWQWCASTGCDAQPYFRIFNPITQSKKFDSTGSFIRQYLPELKNFSNKQIHWPHVANNEIQKQVKCILGEDYPQPIVIHSEQRIKALNLFKSF